jgi:hypothetical protein
MKRPLGDITDDMELDSTSKFDTSVDSMDQGLHLYMTNLIEPGVRCSIRESGQQPTLMWRYARSIPVLILAVAGQGHCLSNTLEEI